MSRRTLMVLLGFLAGFSCWVGAREVGKGLPDAIFAAGFENTRPVANAGADRSVVLGAAATLSGSGVDAEGGALSYAWQVLSQPAGSNVVLTNPATATPGVTPLVVGVYRFELVVSDGALLSVPDAVEITVVESAGPPPVANAGAAQTVLRGVQVQLSGAGSSDPRNLPLTYAWSVDAVPDGANVSLDRPTAVDPRFTATLAGLYRLRLQVGNGLTVSAPSLVEISAVPPAVEGVAPPLPTTGVTTPAAATRFLYTGPDPIQTGVEAGAIDELRGAAVSGRVVTRTDVPLPGVTVRVLGRPELGRTVTRADGRFDLAVNGGDSLVLDFTRVGLLGVQRRVKPDWQGQRVLDRVVMIGPDAAATRVSFGRNAGGLVARGSESRDKDGVRRARVFVPPGSEARVVLADGRSVGSLTTATLRITEYTVGDLGENTMPGDLPPTTAYTYAAEIGIDEPVPKEATRVEFGQPLWSYVDNFVGFPVGEVVPSGYYDRGRGVWVPARNGRVLKVLSVTGGLAVLDVTGSGQPATPQQLQDLGITDAERTELAGTFAAGQSFWRTPLEFLPARGGGAGAPWDYNWPFGPPPGAGPPGGPWPPNGPPPLPPPQPPQPPPPRPNDPGPGENPCRSGSVIQCQKRVLMKAVPVTGTPYLMHYSTERAPGRRQDVLRIPLTGATIPASALNARVSIQVAGQWVTQTQPIAPNQTFDFNWNGRDVWNRPLTGAAEATVRVGYEYPAVYYATRRAFNQSFATLGGVPISGGGVPGRATLTLWTEHRITLADDARGPSDVVPSLGGFTLTPHHTYNPVERRLYRGDGTIVDGASVSSNSIVRTLGGTRAPNCSGPNGDGGPVSNASFCGLENFEVGADGSIYVADRFNGRVRRIAPNGIVSTVAGGGSVEPGDVPIPGTSAYLGQVLDVAVDGEGIVYASADDGAALVRVDRNGMIRVIAGYGPGDCNDWTCGDGGPATEATFGQIRGIAVAPDGSLYTGDWLDNSVRKIGTDGIITTVAGIGDRPYTGPNGPVGDGGPAIEASLTTPWGLDVSPAGDLYIADWVDGRLRKVDVSGKISSVAGIGETQYAGPNPPLGDGGPASGAQVAPADVEVLPDGDLAVYDRGSDRVRVIDELGTITTLVGGGVGSGEGGPGPGTHFSSEAEGIASFPDGRIVIGGDITRGPGFLGQVHTVGSALPGVSLGDLVMPSPDGAETYRFSNTGRHLDTRDALTGAIRYQFTYDAAGRLIGITDGDGNLTRIERNAAGAPTAIVSPDNLRTELALDANGLLASVTNPLAEQVRMEYAAGGLLNRYVDARGFASTYTFDVNGGLLSSQDAAGGGTTLTSTSTAGSNALSNTVAARSAMGRTTTYSTTTFTGGAGGQSRQTLYPDGTRTTVDVGPDGVRRTVQPDGTELVERPVAEPAAFGASHTGELQVTADGLTSTSSSQRTVVPASAPGTTSIATYTEQLTANGRTGQRRYDAATRTWETTSAGGRVTRSAVDTLGRMLRVERSGLAATDLVYDTRGRLALMQSGTGVEARTTTYAYDARGFLQSMTDPAGRTVSYERDAIGRPIRATDPAGQVTEYTYDSNGNTTRITPAGRPAHRFTYTAVDRMAAYEPPAISGTAVGDETVSYDLDQAIVEAVRPDGRDVDYTYDTAGRLQAQTIDRGAYTFAYGAASGQLVRIQSPDGVTIDYTYGNALVKRAQWSGPVTGSVQYTYNNDQWPATLSVNGAGSIATTYDADGLPTQVGALMLAYDVSNGLLTGSTLGTVAAAYTYNAFAEPASATVTRGGGTIYAETYTRDKLGRITRKVETVSGVVRTLDYAYDVMGRLREVQVDGVVTDTYTYDANGNRVTRVTGGTSTAYTYDAQDRLLGAGAVSYTYTAAGELRTITDGASVTTLTHDELGDLTGVLLPDGRNVAYVIDGENRRVGKRINGTLVQGFLYQDDLRVVAELGGANALVSRFVYGEKPHVPAYMLRGGRTYRLVTDAVGSVRLVVDTADGAIAQRIDYDAFGRVVSDSAPGFQPFGFAGGLWDRDTGLVRFGARDYDPRTGRWTRKDPAWFADGTNLYAYAKGDPVNLIDTTGDVAVVPLLLALGKFAAPFVTGAAIDLGMQALPKWRAGCDPVELLDPRKLNQNYNLTDAAVSGVVGKIMPPVLNPNWLPLARKVPRTISMMRIPDDHLYGFVARQQVWAFSRELNRNVAAKLLQDNYVSPAKKWVQDQVDKLPISNPWR
ncbi:MAG: RHS repeat-associated core domain-containing protein [Pseudomonadota bacterium]